MKVKGQLHVLAALSLRKEPHNPLNRRMGRSQSWSVHYGKRENQLPLPGIQPWFLGHHAQSLLWLNCPGTLINKYWTRYRLWAAVSLKSILDLRIIFWDMILCRKWFETCHTSDLYPPKQYHENLKSCLFITMLMLIFPWLKYSKTLLYIYIYIYIYIVLNSHTASVFLVSLFPSDSWWRIC